MSGSGGGGGGGGFDSPLDDCSTLVIETQLSSPKDDVIATIEVDDQLMVTQQTMEGTSVVVVIHNGQVAGGLASPSILRLRECLAEGTQYKAMVIEKTGGQVRVRVTAV